MVETEIQQQRAHLWRTDGNPLRTIDDARAFIESVGFCLMFPERTLPLLPTWIGAYAGSAERLPDHKHAFADPRAKDAGELALRLIRDRDACEINLNGSSLIVAASLFPFFYALLGDRSPKAPPRSGTHGAATSPLAVTVFETLQKHGPLSKDQLQEQVGRGASSAALDRVLNELWAILKITRIGDGEGRGPLWDVVYRWASESVKEALNISEPEAISALLSKYLEAVMAASQPEIEEFFSRITSRAKVREAVHALLATRELSLLSVGTRTLIRLTPVPELEGKRSRHG